MYTRNDNITLVVCMNYLVEQYTNFMYTALHNLVWCTYSC